MSAEMTSVPATGRGASTCVIVNTGQISSQAMQAMSHTSPTAMVSCAEVKPAGWGHTATQAPQLMQAFQPMSKITGGRFNQIFLYSLSGLK